MDMSKYKGMFLAEAREHLNNMNKLVLALEKEPWKKEDIDSLFRSAHSIKGMAASMGYRDISELSHNMEDMMDRFRKGQITLTSEAADILLEGIDGLERLIGGKEQDTQADVDLAKIIEKFKSYGTQKKVVGKKTVIKIPPSASGPEPSSISPRIFTPGFNISVEISKDSAAPSARAFLILRRIKEHGELLSTTPSEAEIKNGKFSGHLSAKIATDEPKDKIEEAIIGGGEVISVSLEPIVSQAGAGLKPAPAEPSRPETPNLKAEAARDHELPKVVKVNTSLLDYFVNTIGELIINKSGLHQVSRGITSKELKEGLNQLDRLVKDLQTQVMKVRMMPLESVTERYFRVVRDLARKGGKEVNLDIEGQDIELDRSIIEGLGNPLIHLIRNCVDHGIELPDERKASGKPRTARISIKAAREKDQVSIEVSDDGRGMDPERLKEMAVKKGVITHEEAAGMNKNEALFLTCLPGFSTAKEVSDVSGRGVGMDAVKSVVESMGGSLEMDSSLGVGTTITLKLPLTVAIIQSLLVELGPETFAIPINRVLRTLEVESADVKMSQKQRFIDFNGDLIPLFSLRKILGLPPSPAQERFMPVVITEARGRTVGLVVDKFSGQQETFIKPLGRPLNRISGLSGTTVLGDGRTIFLLDMGNLI